MELTAEHWNEVLRINTVGVFLAVQAAAKVMVPRGKGSIICTASVAGIRSGEQLFVHGGALIAARALQGVGAALLTPLGPRSLAPAEPGYRGRHRGTPAERDRAPVR